MAQYPGGAAAKLLASAYSVQAITLAVGVVLARGLTVHERGELALYIASLTLAAGIVTAGTSEFISLNVRVRPGDFRGLLRRLWFLAPHVLIIAALVLLALATPYVDLPRAGPFLTYLVCNLGTAVGLGVLLGLNQIGWLSIIRVMNVAIILASILVLVLVERVSFGACAWLYATSELVTVLVSLRLAHRSWRKTGINSDSRPAPKRVFSTRALVYIPSATIAGLFGSLFERILLIYGDSIGGASYAAYLAVAIAAIAPVTTAGAALVPLSLLAGVEGQVSAPDTMRKRQVATTSLILAGAAIYGLALSVLIPLVYGRGFEPAVAVAQSLLAGSIALSVARNLSARLRGLGKVGSIVRNDATSIVGFAVVCATSVSLGPWPLASVWTLGAAGCASLHALTLRRVRKAESSSAAFVAMSRDEE